MHALADRDWIAKLVQILNRNQDRYLYSNYASIVDQADCNSGPFWYTL